MRRNGALAQDFARRHGVDRWHDDAEAIIHAPDIDAVYIATTTDSHHAYALRCASTGERGTWTGWVLDGGGEGLSAWGC